MIRDIHQTTRERLAVRADFSGQRVLEIGCGKGRVTAMIAEEPDLCVGVEPDANAVCTAASAVCGACFACASGMDLPFSGNAFDLVLFSLSLHHHPDPYEALAEARRVLAPGGRLLVLEPAVDSEIQRLCKVFQDEDRALEQVTAILAQSDPAPLSRDVFSTKWVFADFSELADHFFGYYAEPPDERKREGLRQYLGERADHRPLKVTDTLCLTCLGPG